MSFTPQTVSQAVAVAELNNRAAEAISEQNGYQYIDGSMIANVISPIIARCIAIGRVVRPIIGATEEFVNVIDIDKVLNVTVQLPNMLGVTTRTIGTGGTTNNNGLINRAKKIIPSTTPFNVPLAQYNDQALFFPKLQLTMAAYDVVVETLASYADSIVISMDSYHIAKAIAYAAYRAGIEIGAQVEAGVSAGNIVVSNIIKVDSAHVYDDNYMVKVINELTSKMSKGDVSRQALTFSGPRELVSRIDLINWMTTPKTGFVSNANDYGQKLLLDPNFNLDEVTRNGSMQRSSAVSTKGYALYEANDILFSYAEKWLGLSAGDLSGVLGVVFTPQAYAMGGAASATTNLVQSSEYDGIVCFTYQKFGGAAYRKMFLVVDSSFVFPEALIGTTTSVATKGTQTLTFLDKGATGDKVTVNAIEYTQVAADPVAADHEFVVGADAAATAASLKLALEFDTTLPFDIAVSAGVITFTQKVAGVGTVPAISYGADNTALVASSDLALAAGVTGVKGVYSYATLRSVVAPASWGITTYTNLEDDLNSEGQTFAVVAPGLGLPTA